MTNFFANPLFYAELTGAVILYRLASLRLSADWRRLLLAMISCYFLVTHLNGTQVLKAALIYAVILYLAGIFLRGSNPYPGFWIFVFCGIASVGTMAIFKYPAITSLSHLRIFDWLGLSYLTFRALDLLIDAYNKRTGSYSLPSILAFLFFFPSFFAGPINAYAGFHADTASPPKSLSPDELLRCILRICFGVIKIILLAPFAHSLSLLDLGNPAAYADYSVTRWQAIGSVYAYLLYIYMDFSGYCDIALSAAELFGVRLPENFNFPILSDSPQEFWNRWHMSLSKWCSAHIYFPLTKFLITAQNRFSPLTCSVFAIFVTFTMVGVWHGPGLNWLLYGILHGGMLGGHLYYRSKMNKNFPEIYSRISETFAYRFAGTVLTLSYVAFGLLLIRPWEDTRALAVAIING